MVWLINYDYTTLGIDLPEEEIIECLKENDLWLGDWMSIGWWEFAYTYLRQLGESNDDSMKFADIITYFYTNDAELDEDDDLELYEELSYKFENEFDEYTEDTKMIKFFYHIVELFK